MNLNTHRMYSGQLVVFGGLIRTWTFALLPPLTMLLLLSVTCIAEGNDTRRLGTARLFSNDFLGDGHDRWRTGSYSIAFLKSMSSTQGDMSFSETRLRFDMFSPWAKQSSSGTDRAYGLMTSLGHVRHRPHINGLSYIALELSSISASDFIRDTHQELHDLLGIEDPFFGSQLLSSKIRLSGSAGYAHNLSWGSTNVRPFVELQAGVETFARLGVDVVIGPMSEEVRLVRDQATGHLLTYAKFDKRPGASFVVGADLTRVFGSELFGSAVSPKEQRHRARAGIRYESQYFSTFLGLTRLGKEFSEQIEAQTLGSLTVSFRF